MLTFHPWKPTKQCKTNQESVVQEMNAYKGMCKMLCDGVTTHPATMTKRKCNNVLIVGKMCAKGTGMFVKCSILVTRDAV